MSDDAFQSNAFQIDAFQVGFWIADYFLGSPTIDKPAFTIRFNVPDYFLGSPIIAAPICHQIDFAALAFDYFLQSPKFWHPWLTQSPPISPYPPLPPLYIDAITRASNILTGLLNTLMGSLPPNPATWTTQIYAARSLIANLRGNADDSITGSTLGSDLQACFNAAGVAGASYLGIENCRTYLMAQTAESPFDEALIAYGMVMTLSLESTIIASMPFTSRQDCALMIIQAQTMFDDAKTMAIDDLDELTYQTLNSLGGSLLHHLAATELKLPRLMNYTVADAFPSLYLANYIYGDARRADEISDENKTIHPAFCQTQLLILSSPEIARRSPVVLRGPPMPLAAQAPPL